MKKSSPLSYYQSLPKKRMGSGVIIRNKKGEILLLKTSYKDHWEIPGGGVEENESPLQAAEREVYEEIGLNIKIKSCLVIHYRAGMKGQDENIMFVSDGGILENLNKLKLDGKEIVEAKFVSFEQATSLVGTRIGSRLPFCKQALKEKRTLYLESIKKMKATAF